MGDYEGIPIFYNDPPATISNACLVAKKYPGDPLPSNNHIRLVELWKPLLGAFTLRFHTVCLDTAPDFHALSYTWGTTFSNVPLLGLRITENLSSALVNLAGFKRKLWWIDALCINQEDVEEKNAQVPLMREIYSKAKQVYAWLGEPDRASVNLLHKICTRMSEQDFLGIGDNIVREKALENLERYGLPGFEDPAWMSLLIFADRPYFSRVWVVQELVMAGTANITVACGRVRFSWDWLSKTINWIRMSNLAYHFQWQPNDLQQRTWDVITLTSRWILPRAERRRPLEDLLGMACDLESRNPRDKIIALLGLVSPTDPCLSEIKIDYGQPVNDFFRDVTGIVITKNNSLKLLFLCEDVSRRKIPDLPSWVPDYTHAGRVFMPRYRYDCRKKSDTGFNIKWSHGSNVLSFDGRLMDEIESVSNNIPRPGCQTSETLLVWFSMLVRSHSIDEWDWIRSLGDPNKQNAMAEAFWRCMVADCAANQNPAPLEYGNHFAAALFSAFHEHQRASEDLDAWVLGLSYSVLAHLLEQDLLLSFKDDPIVKMLFQHVKSREEMGYFDSGVPMKFIFPPAWVNVGDNPKRLLLGPSGDPNAFMIEMTGATCHTSFFLTKVHPGTQAMRMGRGPMSTKPGDRIAVAKGTTQVFILRQDGKYFRLLGECYVDGLMHGEAQEDGTYERISLI